MGFLCIVHCSISCFLEQYLIFLDWVNEKKKQPITQFTQGPMAGKRQRQNSDSSLIRSITYSYCFLFEIIQAHRRTEVTIQGTIEPFDETWDLTFWRTRLVCRSLYIYIVFSWTICKDISGIFTLHFNTSVCPALQYSVIFVLKKMKMNSNFLSCSTHYFIAILWPFPPS